MTWGSRAQRRANEFDAMVEGISTVESRDAELLELVGAMRTVPPVAARPEFVADLRERLMAEAETALVPADLSKLKLPDRRPTRERRLAAVVGGIAIVGATTSIAVAAQSALPGDSLYPIKRAIEEAQTGLAVGEGSKGSTILANASDRLDEVDALTRQDGVGDDARIAETLDTFTEQSIEASDLLLSDYAHTGHASSISQLHDFASSSLDQLAALEPLVPADARDELIRAAGVLATIDAEAARQCPTCGGTPIESIPPVLVAGEPIIVPQPPAPSASEHAEEVGGTGDKGDKGDSGQGGQGDEGDDTDLPDVEPDEVGPGSVLEPDGGSLLPGDGQTGGSNPIRDLTDGLTGGGSPTGTPSPPVVGDAVDDVGSLLEGIVGPTTGQTQKP